MAIEDNLTQFKNIFHCSGPGFSFHFANVKAIYDTKSINFIPESDRRKKGFFSFLRFFWKGTEGKAF